MTDEVIDTPAPGGQGGTPPGQAPAPASWVDGLDEDSKAYVTGKGWPDIGAVIKSTRNLESMVRGDPSKIVRIPGDDADEKARADFYQKLGRPEAPNGYEIPVPEGGDDTFAKWAQEKFHKLGLSKSQGENLVKEWGQFLADHEGKEEADYSVRLDQEQLELKKTWGAAHDKKIFEAQGAAIAFGADEKMINAMEQAIGYKATMEFFANIGAKLGEDKYVDNGGGNGNFSGALTPAEAKQKIASLKADPEFRKKHLAGNPDTKAQMDALHQLAYGSR